MRLGLLMICFWGVSATAGPESYGSKDGKIKARLPLERKAGKAERTALERKEVAKLDLRVPVVIGDLPPEALALLPEGIDLQALVAKAFTAATRVRAVFATACADNECLSQRAAQELSQHLSDLESSGGEVSDDGKISSASQAAKERQSIALISLSMDAERRVTLMLSESPGRGLLASLETPPLEAADHFETVFLSQLDRMLRIGSPLEGKLEEIGATLEKEVTEAERGEPAHVLAMRQKLKVQSKYGIYGGGTAAGLGLALGVYTAINAHRWRNLSYREPDYREDFREAVSAQGTLADILFVGGGLVMGASYWARHRADKVGAFAWLAGAPPQEAENQEVETAAEPATLEEEATASDDAPARELSR